MSLVFNYKTSTWEDLKIPTYDKKMTPKQRMKMRVSIAKDVLKMIAADKIEPTHGTYLDGVGVGSFSKTSRAQLDAKLKRAKCEVCALGSLFVAEVIKNDKLTCGIFAQASDLDRQGAMRERLAPFFTVEELESIEGAFEGRDYGDKPCGATDTLTKIMNIIIKNDGEWKPRQLGKKWFCSETSY